MRAVLIFLLSSLLAQTLVVRGMWLFQQQPQLEEQLDENHLSSNHNHSSIMASLFEQATQQQQEEKVNQVKDKHAGHSHSSTGTSSGSPGTGQYNSYGSSFLSIAGIQPASLTTLLGTMGDTGFRYFNIQDQCRNRAACDLGAMLYKKLSFVHNWLVRTSVRSLADMNNVYLQSWMEGMTGRNCSTVYINCRQSPLDGLMNLAMLQNLVY